MSDTLQLSLSPTVAGQQFGDYHLMQYLGEGASATIYLAEHRYFNKQVAIKILRTPLEDNQLQSFWAEAHLAASLAHPHIVPVHDFGLMDAVPFLVMEYAPYGTLRTRHEAGHALSPGLVCQYVSQIARALQCMHNHGFVHRDLKPENLLLGQRQQVLLSDFGISIAIDNVQEHNETRPIGSLLYMAPEQIQGRPCPASDQYALGVLVYEWLCGTWPFRGTPYALARQHLYAEPPSICTIMPTVPAPMEQVVLKALAKDPAQRFAHVREFARALENAYRAALFTKEFCI